MATIGQLRDALSDLFGMAPMRLKALSQAMNAASLRTDGGAGRGAAPMTGADVGIHAIAIMANLSTREAPEVLRSLVDMSLVPTDTSADGMRSERDDIIVSDRFGGALGQCIEKSAASIEAPNIRLEISMNGGYAQFIRDGGEFPEAVYSTTGRPPARQKWEQMIRISAETLQDLGAIYAFKDRKASVSVIPSELSVDHAPIDPFLRALTVRS